MSIEISERYGVDVRRRLFSADRFNEAAMARGLRSLNTESSSVIASLVSVTRCDHFLTGFDLRAAGLTDEALEEGCDLPEFALRVEEARGVTFERVAFLRRVPAGRVSVFAMSSSMHSQCQCAVLAVRRVE